MTCPSATRPIACVTFTDPQIASAGLTKAQAREQGYAVKTSTLLSFNRMAEKLSQTKNMRRQLITDIAHELRTPLTTIEGYMVRMEGWKD